MVNLYNLEYELLNKSSITNRAPSSITSDVNMHIPGYDECKCCIEAE